MNEWMNNKDEERRNFWTVELDFGVHEFNWREKGHKENGEGKEADGELNCEVGREKRRSGGKVARWADWSCLLNQQLNVEHGSAHYAVNVTFFYSSKPSTP